MPNRIVSVNESMSLPAEVRARLAADLGGTAPANVLGATFHNPADQVELINPNANTLTAIDPANLAVTFTAPASGKVTVDLEAEVTEAGGLVTWGLVQNGALIPQTRTRIAPVIAPESAERKHATMLVTGLTAGQRVTFQWATAVTAGTMRMRVGGSEGTHGNGSAVSGPASMIVRDAPF